MPTSHSMTRPDALHFSANADANRLLAADPTALLIGFLLDQQITVQKAFEGPYVLQQRVGTIDPAALAALPLENLHAAFAEKPALHRFHGNMSKRVHAAMQHVVDEYDGDTETIWTTAADSDELRTRLEAIPGIGNHTATTFISVLAQRFELPFTGWEDLMPSWGSLGAVSSPQELDEYQQRKREYKAAKRAARKQ